MTATEDSDGSDSICHVYSGNQRANARLISAAPDLVEALRELADFSIDDLHYRHIERSKIARERAYELLEKLGG